MQLEGKAAIITGSGRGIGKAMALGLAKEGAWVAVVDISNESAEEVAREIRQTGRETLAIQVDVTNQAMVEKMVRTVLGRWGKVDILVNNAGIFHREEVFTMLEETWDLTIDVHLKGTFLCSKHVIGNMMERRYGKIVNMTSGINLRGQRGGAHYAAAKAGIIGFTKSLALEMAPFNVNVNALGPGLTDTAMSRSAQTEKEIEETVRHLPNQTIGQPEDTVPPLLFLVTDASRHITGQVTYMRMIG